MRRILLAVLSILMFSVAVTFASVPTSYDQKLTTDDVFDSGVLGNVERGQYFVFDYWYNPDPMPELPNTSSGGVPQNFLVFTNGFRSVLDVSVYFPSTAWQTVGCSAPKTGDLEVYIPRYSTNDWEETEIGWEDARYLYNEVYLKDFRVYDSYEDYMAGGGSSSQPVPEPGTFAMMGTALMGFFGLNRFRRGKR